MKKVEFVIFTGIANRMKQKRFAHVPEGEWAKVVANALVDHMNQIEAIQDIRKMKGINSNDKKRMVKQ